MFAVIPSKQCIIIKTIIRFGFCDIQNNQSLGKCYQPRPSARLITLTSTLIIPDITKPHPVIVYNRKPQVISGWWGGGGALPAPTPKNRPRPGLTYLPVNHSCSPNNHLIISLLQYISIALLPPPSHFIYLLSNGVNTTPTFYCFPSITITLNWFSLHHHHHHPYISTVFYLPPS